jgi:large subunit ribosomal protein L23
MGLFNKKDSAKKEEKAVEVVTETKPKAAAKKDDKKEAVMVSPIIKNPRITEKAAYASDKNVYTFDVLRDASSVDIAKAIFSIYKVKPVKVNVVALPKKKVMRQNVIGVKGGGKKAYVYLKKGDKIEFV